MKEDFRHIVLFSKGHYEYENTEHYWEVLKEIISNYNGLEVENILDIYIYEITSNAVKCFLNVSFDKWNEIYFQKKRFYESESQLHLMILTNLSLLSTLSIDDVGGSWDWIKTNNLLDIKCAGVNNSQHL